MPWRNWDQRSSPVAIWLLLVVVVVIAFGASRVGYQSDEPVGDARAYGVEQGQDDNIGDPVPGGFDPWKDPYPQWIMAAFAVIATGVSAWAVLKISETLQATRDGNRIARESAERQLRAYVGVETANIAQFEEGKPNAFKISLRNRGQTPAYQFRTMGVLQLHNTRDARVFLKGMKEVSRTDLGINQVVHSVPTSARALNGQEWADVRAGRRFIIVAGVASYVDAFKRRRLITYRFVLDFDERGLPVLTTSPKNNRSN